MLRKLTISLKRDEAFQATRVTIGKNKLVYVLVADKRLKYKKGTSKIAYVGTTEKGAERIAQSLALKADKILRLHGVRRVHAKVLTCRPRKHVETWRELERALLLCFRGKFGEVPKYNLQGKRMKATNEFRYSRRARVENVIDQLSWGA